MKTNVPITLTDAERNQLAAAIDGEPTKRMVSRKEVIELCEQAISYTLSMTPAARKVSVFLELTEADPEDVDQLRDKHPEYIRGWNKAKRGFRT